MESVEKNFIEALTFESGSMQGYSLDFVKRSIVPAYEGELPNILRLEYIIPTSKIGLQFSLAISTGALLNVRIYNSSGQSFSLDDYLTKHKKTAIIEKLFADRRDLTKSLNQIIAIFNGDMKGIVTGKQWEEIPFDWMGYK